MGRNEALLPGDEEKEELFFDSTEDFPVSLNSSPKALTNLDLYQNLDSSYQIWLNGVENLQNRREKFFKSMGLDLNVSPTVEPELHELNSFNEVIDESFNQDPYRERSMSDGERTSSSSSTLSSLSRLSSGSHDNSFDVGFDLLIKNMDSGATFVIDEVAQDGSLTRLRELGSNQTVTGGDFLSIFGSSQFVLNLMQKEDISSKHIHRREKNNWLRRLGIKAHGNDKLANQTESDSVKSNRMREEAVFQRVNTCTHKKHWRELSEVYMCQDFKAHDGAILAMKFSHDGKFLATGGEDGILHVWSVIECERNKDIDFQRDDSSSVCLTINENYQIAPVIHNDENKDRHVKWHGSSTCVVIPERVFGIEKEPLQDLRGHAGDVLDISWSKTKVICTSFGL
jgi:WD40 repeat protein